MNDTATPDPRLPDPDGSRPPTPVEPTVTSPFRPPRWSVAGQAAHAGNLPFQEVTYRLPLGGERPVVRRVVVLTGEVVVRKTRGTERREVRGTVRRQEIEVERDQPGADAGMSLGGTEHA